ncbi:MAG: hypothetical protein ACH0QD_13350 [Tepidibacillus sp.]
MEMVIKGHLGMITVTKTSNGYRVKVHSRRIVIFGDAITMNHGRFVLEKKGTVAFLMDDCQIVFQQVNRKAVA